VAGKKKSPDLLIKKGKDMSISRESLAILACPSCKSAVALSAEKLICEKCGRCYPVKDGVPVMLVDGAERPDPRT